MFVSEIELLVTEMKWQMKLGQVSNVLKTFANQWKILSWVNFALICLINFMFINYLTIDPVTGSTMMDQVW